MAANLQQLKRRIKTAKNIAQVARSMEMISASKIKKAQTLVENNKPYASRIINLTSSILSHVNPDKFKNPYIDGNASDKTLLIIISTDKGLCGSLNTNLFKKLIELDSKDLKIVALGKRSFPIASRLDGELIANMNIGTTLPEYSHVFRLIEVIKDEYLTGNVGSVKLLFNEFESIFTQLPKVANLLPIEKVEQEERPLPYIVEPRAEVILNDLMPYYLEILLYTALIEAFTSEQAARMVAMQNAKNNALDIADYLTLSYNKSRQERITNELLSLNSA